MCHKYNSNLWQPLTIYFSYCNISKGLTSLPSIVIMLVWGLVKSQLMLRLLDTKPLSAHSSDTASCKRQHPSSNTEQTHNLLQPQSAGKNILKYMRKFNHSSKSSTSHQLFISCVVYNDYFKSHASQFYSLNSHIHIYIY